MPSAKYCSDLAESTAPGYVGGYCTGPGGIYDGVNGKSKGSVPTRSACQAGCDASPACVGYSYSARGGYCNVYGPGLDRDPAGGWMAMTYPTTTMYAAASPNRSRQHWVKLLYDTGATSTSLDQEAATKLGYNAGFVQNFGTPVIIEGVTGDLSGMKLYMQFYVRLSDDGEPEDWRQVGGDATVSNTTMKLLGVSHIAQLQSSYKVKFV
eukprot:COSAG01_NODE_14269_length_1474_cov_1.792000_2_plen_209_part_00